MRLRNTLLLGILCAALGAYVYFVEFEKAEEEAKKKTLLEVKQEDITAVTLSYPDREIALEKSGDSWTMTKPVKAAADQISAGNLARAIAECELKKTLDDAPADLSPFGLDQPQITVRVKTKDKELPAIKIGKNTPVGYNTYVQLEGNPKIFLTGSAFEAGMKKEPRDLRDKQILNVADDAVTRITLAATDRNIVLAKSGDQWKIEQPGPFAADAATVRSLIGTLRSARATDFPAEEAVDLAEYGLDQPRLTLTVTSGPNNEEKKLIVGKDKDDKELYVKAGDRPTIFTVSDWVFRDLDKKVNDLRDKSALAFEKDAVREITLQRADETIRLSRADKDKEWQIAGNDTKPDQTRVETFVGDLKDLKGHEIASDDPAEHARYGLAAPLLTITVKDASAPVGTIKLGSYKGEGDKSEYAMVREGDSTVIKLREFNFNRVNKKLEDFLPKPTPTPGTEKQDSDAQEDDEEP